MMAQNRVGRRRARDLATSAEETRSSRRNLKRIGAFSVVLVQTCAGRRFETGKSVKKPASRLDFRKYSA
jgi:hypothetical protein